MLPWVRRAFPLALALPAASVSAEVATPYVDPNEAFALRIPAEWKASAHDLDKGIRLTALEPAGDNPAARVFVIAVSSLQPIDPKSLHDVADVLCKLGIAALQEDAKITSEKRFNTRFNGQDAVRIDISTRDDDGIVSNGYLIVTLGKTHAVLIAASAPAKDPSELSKADAVVASFAIESRTPHDAPVIASDRKGGLFTTASLARTAAAARNKPSASSEELLVAGDPPLTLGSVRNFVRVVEITFDVRLNDAEFEATRDRFVAYYGKADEQGRRVLARGGEELLQNLTSGTPEQREAQRQEVADVMGRRIADGARQGIVWAQVLQEALRRRGQSLAEAKGPKPAVMKGAEVKTQLTEASLNASVEMLYFMWVAAGRDPARATPDAIAAIREGIRVNFGRFPADVQYLFANAEKIYADLRTGWQQADAATQQTYAQQFGLALDSMGLINEPSSQANARGRRKSAWDDVNPDDIHSGLVMNTCWNLAQKATR